MKILLGLLGFAGGVFLIALVTMWNSWAGMTLYASFIGILLYFINKQGKKYDNENRKEEMGNQEDSR